MIINADARRIPLKAGTVQTCVTSPPYYGLRNYDVDGQIGLEETPEEYVDNLVRVFREVRRVLRDDGTLWVVIGDSYAGSWGNYGGQNRGKGTQREIITGSQAPQKAYEGKESWRPPTSNKLENIKPKDLIGIPWMVAFALRADGWYLRSDVIWCLSGGAYVYAKTQKGVLPTMVRDIARLDPSTVQLWNGKKWTRLLGMSKSKRRGDEIELVLRSGERISCTPTHKFPTKRGLIEAENMVIGDAIQTCQLPDVENPRDCAIDTDAAWLAGLYLAEGSRSDDCIQVAGHSKETERWERVCQISAKYGGSCTRTISGNQMNIRIHGKILNAIIDEFVTGRTAKDKGFSPSVWKYSNAFVSAVLDGYLSGDGHFDEKNNRWRLGFTRNYNLERDLRTACARLGYHLTLKLSTVSYNDKQVPTFRGELRKERTGHHNEKDMGEVVEIRKSKCREVYDLGVKDDPHLFSLASGVLTHNSKPNPMPESVKDRPTKAHEYIFLLSKSQRYYYDADAIAEPAVTNDLRRPYGSPGANALDPRGKQGEGKLRSKAHSFKRENSKRAQVFPGQSAGTHRPDRAESDYDVNTRNKRSVWTVSTKPYPEAHFAVYPPDLIEPCILAGTSEKGQCPECGSPWVRVTEKEKTFESGSGRSGNAITGKQDLSAGETNSTPAIRMGPVVKVNTIGWEPSCGCDAGEPVPQIVLDPFGGSGTTGEVAAKHRRKYVLCDLSMEYIGLQKKRVQADVMLPGF